MKPSSQEMLNKGVYDWFLGERQKEPGVESEAAGEGEGAAAAQEPGEPPQGRERGRQEALSGKWRWHTGLCIFKSLNIYLHRKLSIKVNFIGKSAICAGHTPNRSSQSRGAAINNKPLLNITKR